MKVFIDSNIPMYVAGRDHQNRGSSLRFMQRVRSGEVEGCTSTEVLQEILYRYTSLKRLDLAAQVYDLFVAACPIVHPVALADTDRAKELLVGSAGKFSARDAVHAAVMLNHGVTRVATFDRGFDAIKGVERYAL